MTYADVFGFALRSIVQRIEEERSVDEAVIWGGDFKQALTGRDFVGTGNGREALDNAFDRLDLQVPTWHMPALIEAHPAIDHLAIPKSWTMLAPVTVSRPQQEGRFLSDHALYIVEANAPPR